MAHKWIWTCSVRKMGRQRILNVPKNLHELMEEVMGENKAVEVTVKPLYFTKKKKEDGVEPSS
jgi:hypothetical protein